ncbi:MAG: hypothetical protein ABSF32_04860 [Ignavibacteria bacterium]
MLKLTKLIITAIIFILFASTFAPDIDARPRHVVYLVNPHLRVVRMVRPFHRYVWVRGHYRVNGYGFLVWIPGHRVRV